MGRYETFLPDDGYYHSNKNYLLTFAPYEILIRVFSGTKGLLTLEVNSLEYKI